MKVLSKMTIDEMPNEDMRTVAEVLGVDVAMGLMQNFNGTRICIPKRTNIRRISTLLRTTSLSPREIAKELGVGQRTVYRKMKSKNIL